MFTKPYALKSKFVIQHPSPLACPTLILKYPWEVGSDDRQCQNFRFISAGPPKPSTHQKADDRQPNSHATPEAIDAIFNSPPAKSQASRQGQRNEPETHERIEHGNTRVLVPP